MRATIVFPAFLLGTVLAVTARADGFAASPNLGLPQGLGLDLTYRLSPHFNVRAGGALPATAEAEDVEFGDIQYDTEFKLGGLNAFVDWHPFAGNFHLSAGAVTLRRPWTLEASSTSSYSINGVRYPANEVGRLSGEIDTGNRVAPTLLVGWGNAVRPGKRWGAVLDLGLSYAGRRDFRLKADGALAGDAAFGRDLAREMEEHSSDHSLWLFVKVGVSYQF